MEVNVAKIKTPSAPQSTDLKENNIYLFMEDFESSTVEPVIEFILEKNFIQGPKKPKYLTLMICSPGGEMNAAFALIDVMRGSSIPIHTVGLGQIASCGILTFMSGERGHRILTPNTSILSHEWAWGRGGKAHELFAVQREYDLTQDRMMDLYKTATGLDEKTIKKVLLPPHDVWLSAEEAVKYGIADKIKDLKDTRK
jgi:ATP-dependent Clp protease protease subunit